jgi:hypothetical protein
MMSLHSNPVSAMFRGAALALTILFFVGDDGNAQSRATQGSASSAEQSLDADFPIEISRLSI